MSPLHKLLRYGTASLTTGGANDLTIDGISLTINGEALTIA